MTKKLVSLALTIVFLMLVVACNGTYEEVGENIETETKLNNHTEKISICNLVNGNLGDLSIFDSAESGLVKLEQEGIIDYKTIQMGGTDADQPRWLSVLQSVSESEEYDIIICGTPQYADYVANVAAQYPKQHYIAYDMEIDLPNVISVTYAQNDMGFIIGVIASKYSEILNNTGDNVIGFVGGMEIDTINDFLWGYIEGATYVNPKVKIDAQYVGNFWDTATAKEIANTMIEVYNCDIIWGVASAAGIGAAEAAHEHDIKFIGVDSDQEIAFSESRPELAKITITSGLKNVGNSFIYILEQLEAGKINWGDQLKLGIKEDGVGIAKQGNYLNLPQEIRDLVNDVENKIINDEIQVGTAFGNDISDLRQSVSPRI